MNGSSLRAPSSFALASLLAFASACGEPQAPKQPDSALVEKPVPTGVAPQPATKPAADEPKTADIQQAEEALKRKDFTAAKDAAERALKKNPASAEANYYLGLVAENTKNGKDAERYYRAALTSKPDLEDAALNLGALLLDGNRADEAIEIWRKATTVRKDSAALQANLAMALTSKPDGEADATKAFDEAVKLAPNDPMILLSYGKALGGWKKQEAAAKKLEAARNAAKGDVGLLASVGFEQKNIGAFDDCTKTLSAAITQQDAAELRTYRALCKLGQKDKPGMIADLEAAIAKDAKYAPAHFYLAGRMAEDGKKKEATAGYERYLALEPKGPLAAKAKERIELLKKKK
jgi:Tfp pilus assembly protein PilF